MQTFAVALCSRPTTDDGILLMVDDLQAAEEIAAELQRKGHRVTVREVLPPGARSTTSLPAAGS